MKLGTAVICTIGPLLILVLLIIGLPYIAGLSMIPAATQTALTGLVTNLNELFPFIGLMIIVGVIGIYLADRE